MAAVALWTNLGLWSIFMWNNFTFIFWVLITKLHSEMFHVPSKIWRLCRPGYTTIWDNHKGSGIKIRTVQWKFFMYNFSSTILELYMKNFHWTVNILMPAVFVSGVTWSYTTLTFTWLDKFPKTEAKRRDRIKWNARL